MDTDAQVARIHMFIAIVCGVASGALMSVSSYWWIAPLIPAAFFVWIAGNNAWARECDVEYWKNIADQQYNCLNAKERKQK